MPSAKVSRNKTFVMHLSEKELETLDRSCQKVTVQTSRGVGQPVMRQALVRDFIRAGIRQINAGTFEFDPARESLENQPVVNVRRR